MDEDSVKRASSSAGPGVVLITEQVRPGGKRSHVDALGAGLTSIGWDVSVIDWNCFSIMERAWVAGPGRVLNAFRKGAGNRWMIEMFAPRAAAHLVALLRNRSNVAVVNLQEPFVLRAVRRVVHGLPFALTIHGPAHREIASGFRLSLDDPAVTWLRAVEEKAFRDADALISVDLAHAEYARAMGRRDRLWTIPNFVDTTAFHPAIAASTFPASVEERIAGRPVLLCPRLLVAKNGVHVAIEAMRILVDRSIACALVVAGDGPERAALEGRVRELGLGGAVCFLGVVPTSLMAGYYRRSALILVPSVSSMGVEEATSISVLEAQACGRPVVASALGGLREIIENRVTGILAAPGNAEAFALAVKELLEDPDLSAALGVSSVEHIREKHSHVVAAHRYTEVYRAIGARVPSD